MVLLSSYVSVYFQSSSCLSSVKESFPVEVISNFLVTFSLNINNGSVTLNRGILWLTWNLAVVLHNVDLLSFDESHDKDAIIYLILLSGYSSLRSSWSSHILFCFCFFFFSPLICSGHHLRTTLTHLGQPFALDCNEWSLRLGEKCSYLSGQKKMRSLLLLQLAYYFPFQEKPALGSGCIFRAYWQIWATFQSLLWGCTFACWRWHFQVCHPELILVGDVCTELWVVVEHAGV